MFGCLRDKNMRTVLYSAIAGGYDESSPRVVSQGSVDQCLLFAEGVSVSSGLWHVNDLVMPPNIKRADLRNRYHKFFPYLLPFDADVSIYLDGNVEVKKDLEPLIKEFLQSKKVLGCLRHPQRDNILQEVDACISLGKFKGADRERVSEQIRFYSDDDFPLDFSLQAATVLFRRHDDLPLLHDAMSLWWDQIMTFTARDQISLPYVLWKTRLPFISFDLNIFDNEYFHRHPHRRKKSLITEVKQKIGFTIGRFRRFLFR